MKNQIKCGNPVKPDKVLHAREIMKLDVNCIKKEMLKAFSSKDEKLIKYLLSVAEENGIDKKRIIPKGCNL